MNMNSSSSPNSAAQGRILVVEDQQDALEALALLLELQGFEVVTARDGASALDTARRAQPRVVLLDLGLPDMDGLDVARRLRREHGQALTVVALTGYARDEDINAAREAGCDRHLAKPVDLDALTALLDLQNR